ncbi:hypothetical protein DL96DRAFT_1629960 [Flagelloscypha sp. PMI_526]|nr:hypothetical protein DL96DRAFT_1629960 [Flagelloscypha sp. PMI_526]
MLAWRLSKRCFSSTLEHVSPARSVFILNSTDPWFNLSFEDWLFRNAPNNSPKLLLYRCRPSNPWAEVNFPALKSDERNIEYVRRRSGGGTVYHDFGNTNFSIHTSRLKFNRDRTSQLVRRAVESLGIRNVTVNERNDVCAGDKKVSGSAYKIISHRAYHHGTMLLSTDLSSLGNILRVPEKVSLPGVDIPSEIQGKIQISNSIASVRSPVVNLRVCQGGENVSHETFCEAVIREFGEEYKEELGSATEVDPVYVDEHTALSRDTDSFIRKGIEELKTWDWMYGQTPQFTFTYQDNNGDIELHLKRGVVVESKKVFK